MHNLLQLIVRFSNFLLLVGLEVVAFIFVIRGNKYQQMVADKMGEKQWVEDRHHSHEVRTGSKAEEHVAYDVLLT